MKKTKKVAKRPAKPKTKAPRTVEEYIAGFPEATQTALADMREAIRSVVPGDAVEIISYGIPAFRHRKVLVWYGGFSDHCSLFPTAAIVEAFKDELKPLANSKGTIHFPLDQPLPISLIKRMVKARVAQNEEKTRSSPRK